MISKSLRRIASIATASLFAGAASAQQSGLIIYPKGGQSAEQQQKDKGECTTWATQQTGFDPAHPPAPPTAQVPQAQRGTVAKSTARGAAVGAVGGAVADDAGKGAEVGAAVGATAGAMKRRQQKKEIVSENQAATQKYQSDLAAAQGQFNKAMKACLEGRNYSVD